MIAITNIHVAKKLRSTKYSGNFVELRAKLHDQVISRWLSHALSHCGIGPLAILFESCKIRSLLGLREVLDGTLIQLHLSLITLLYNQTVSRFVAMKA